MTSISALFVDGPWKGKVMSVYEKADRVLVTIPSKPLLTYLGDACQPHESHSVQTVDYRLQWLRKDIAWRVWDPKENCYFHIVRRGMVALSGPDDFFGFNVPENSLDWDWIWENVPKRIDRINSYGHSPLESFVLIPARELYGPCAKNRKQWKRVLDWGVRNGFSRKQMRAITPRGYRLRA